MKQLVNISLVEEMIRKLKEAKSSRVLKILNWSQKVKNYKMIKLNLF
jgi:hypothetical protein